MYFVKPPNGCTRSPPGTYWKLLCSLYGLRRAPKLWFEWLGSHLKSMGLTSSTISPCLFVGQLIERGPPIYVDDIIYFSVSDAVEKKFESLLSTIRDVDFMDPVSHFLGIEFSWINHPDGHLSISLTQQWFAESFIDSLGLPPTGSSTYSTPYRSGMSIDSLPHQNLSAPAQDLLTF